MQFKKNIVSMQQVHGDRVVRVTVKDSGKIISNCDALITNDPKISLRVRVADCLPISITDNKNNSFGLVHAGWRGLKSKIIEKTVYMMMREFFVKPKDLNIKIGPHICQEHFEVKADVSSEFKDYPVAILEKSDKIFLDLAKIAELQLIEVGVKKENIKVDQRCTFEDISLYSFRRNKTYKRNTYLIKSL